MIGSLEEPTTLNPFLEDGSSFATGLVGQASWVGVQDLDPSRELIPDVVVELPTLANGGLEVNDDGTVTVRYVIRDEAVWEDGTPISGSDFEFTHELATSTFLPIRPALRDAYRAIVPDSLEVGDKTFAYRLDGPALGYEVLFDVLVPRHQVEGSDFANDWNDRLWMAGGPFRFDSWDGGRSLTLQRNDAYWKADPATGQRLPYLDLIRFEFFDEPLDMVAAFKERRLTVIEPPFSTELIAEVTALGAELQMEAGPGWEHLNFQFGPGRLDRNPESLNLHLDYRRAVAHLVDRQAIADEIVGGAVAPLSSFFELYWPPASRGVWARYVHDPGRAEELLAGLADELGRDVEVEPFRAVFSTTNESPRVMMAESLVQMFAAGGIELDVQLEERGLFFADSVEEGTWDMGEWAWVARPGRSGLVTSLEDLFLVPPPGGLNYYGWGTSGEEDAEAAQQAEELLEGLDEVLDRQELVERLREVEEILADQVVIIPLYPEPNPGLVWSDQMAGYRHNPTGAGDTWNAGLWHRARR